MFNFNLKSPMNITGKMSKRAANASGKIVAIAWLIVAIAGLVAAASLWK